MFRFKQFTVIQDNSAMKVCTDSCLFGALIDAKTSESALDIGTGTGLLSLMLAQRYPALKIDAVEIDAGAAGDARLNFENSPFNGRIHLHECSVQWFSANTAHTYDLIFCNPPFYENGLKSADNRKNLAHHAAELSFHELAGNAERLLGHTGNLWILLPPFEMSKFIEEAAEHSLSVNSRHRIRHNTARPVFREVVSFSRQSPENPVSGEIIIYENDQYSCIFASLLRDYYLIF